MKTTAHQCRRRGTGGRPGGQAVRSFLLLSFLFPVCGAAQELGGFHVTEVRGKAELRYLYNEILTRQGGATTLYEARPTWEEEVWTLTRSYVYHPNLVDLDLGGGVVLVQNRFESLDEERRSDDTLLNLLARARILRKKPYPLTLFYERENPSIYPGLVERFQQTNSRYGLDLSLRPPVSPLVVEVDATRETQEGAGPSLIVDESIDRANMRAYYRTGSGDHVQAVVQWSRQHSASGSPDLPITPARDRATAVTLDSAHTLGSTDRFRLTNYISRIDHEGTYPRRETRFTPFLRWTHTERLKTIYRYSYLDASQEDIDTTNQSGQAELFYSPGPDTQFTADLHADDNDTTNLRSSTRGANASYSHKRYLPFGTWQMSAALRSDATDRVSGSDTAQVIGEVLVLEGTTPVPLAHEFVVPGSVVIQNATRTQTYVEGVDYRLIVVGATTSVQRLVTGSILDGEQVLADYAYQTGGTFGFASREWRFSTTLTVIEHVDLYLRYRDRTLDLTSGVSSLPLNSLRNTTYGLRFDLPLQGGMALGGDASHERQDEVIAPYQGTRYSAYLQLPLARLYGSLRLGYGRIRVDVFGSAEDTDLTRQSVVLQSRPWPRVLLNLEYSDEVDTGGTLDRTLQTAIFRARWRYRRLVLSAEADRLVEEQGDTARERLLYRITLRRDF